jgi:hypothetical protein
VTLGEPKFKEDEMVCRTEGAFNDTPMRVVEIEQGVREYIYSVEIAGAGIFSYYESSLRFPPNGVEVFIKALE